MDGASVTHDELGELRFLEETGSTNDDMQAIAREGAAEGTWLYAGRQISGRGRMGRKWEGVEGNIYASSLVRLKPEDPPSHTLSFVAAIAIYDALLPYLGASPLHIKWPNDILSDGAKLSGILLDQQGDAVVVGIGINVVGAPKITGRKTTCLRDIALLSCDRLSVLNDVRRTFREELQIWRKNGVRSVFARWLERSYPAGTPVTATLADSAKINGVFAGLNDDGGMILRDGDGGLRVIHAADVALL